MNPLAAATTTGPGIVGIGGRFMFSPPTYLRATELGFGRMEFYVTGRGGALGVVDADVVAGALFWFEPSTVRAWWDAGTAVLAAPDAAAEWAGCAHAWGECHLADAAGLERLGELAGRVVDAAGASGAPVFAGWRRLPLPANPAARAVHQLNALRELRGAYHGGAVLAAGLQPIEAVALKSPFMARQFGWPKPLPDVAGLSESWQSAEDGTNRAMGRALSVLDPVELDEFAASLAGLLGVSED